MTSTIWQVEARYVGTSTEKSSELARQKGWQKYGKEYVAERHARALFEMKKQSETSIQARMPEFPHKWEYRLVKYEVTLKPLTVEY